MARSILSVVGLSFLLLYQFVDCETRGNLSKTLEDNVGISINYNSTPIVRDIKPISLNTIAEKWEITRNITPTAPNEIKQTLEIPKTIELKGRIVNAQPRPGPVVTSSKAGAPAAPRKPGAALTKTIKYKLGARVPGDRLIASNAIIQQWTAAQNVTQNLSYPRSGTGATITYIEIIVDQSQQLGRAFVTSGGIGQRQIAVTIEAPKTLVFRQNIQIYGY